jgi:hypothetical protein
MLVVMVDALEREEFSEFCPVVFTLLPSALPPTRLCVPGPFQLPFLVASAVKLNIC